MESITPQALESLDQNSRQEIVQFMEAERSKAKIQETVHTFTNLCWNKCIKKVNSAQLDGSEQQCEYEELMPFDDVLLTQASPIVSADTSTPTLTLSKGEYEKCYL
jgi:import inner membrane translocase subunit TIM8